MPHLWEDHAPPAGPDNAGPVERLLLWPHRSLSARGFVIFFAVTAAMAALPLLAVLGTPALWALLPFTASALALAWLALRRNGRDGRLTEVLTLARDSVHLCRREPDGTRHDWRANPYWVRVILHGQGGPVANYVTLRGGGREVEIGAFLSPGERARLHDELRERLACLR